jgi:hypothetical protein
MKIIICIFYFGSFEGTVFWRGRLEFSPVRNKLFIPDMIKIRLAAPALLKRTSVYIYIYIYAHEDADGIL